MYFIFVVVERRLKKVKGNQTKEPTAKDMLSALEKVKEDQMHHLINSSNSVQQSDDELNGAIVNKNHTGKEQNKDEIVAIIHQDVLSKEAEENTENR